MGTPPPPPPPKKINKINKIKNKGTHEHADIHTHTTTTNKEIVNGLPKNK
jgi:hypothetical protein